MPRLIDVSVPIVGDLPVWPGDPAITVRPATRIRDGDPANVSHLSLGNHTGTHVDPPSHFIEGGRGIDELDPLALVGAAWTAELPEIDGEIGPGDLDAAGIPAEVERLLVKTPNSGTLRPGAPFRPDFVSLSVAAAGWVVDRGLRLIGVDYLSVERYDAPHEHPVHRTLLGGGVVIVEGLDFSGVPGGPCELLCLPVLIAGGDGAPARAFVRLP